MSQKKKWCNRYKREHMLVPAPEGMYTGQYVFCGKKAPLAIAIVLPVGMLKYYPFFVCVGFILNIEKKKTKTKINVWG